MERETRGIFTISLSRRQALIQLFLCPLSSSQLSSKTRRPVLPEFFPIVRSVELSGESCRMRVLMSAVFPVPGAPEMNMMDRILSWFMEAPSTNEAIKLSTVARSLSRPEMRIWVLLQVKRSRTRIRMFSGNQTCRWRRKLRFL